MNVPEKYNELISSMKVVLKNHGLKKLRNKYYLQSNGNWGIIQFQKSQTGTKDKIQFTINLGIASSRLLQAYNPHRMQKPDVRDCHWRIRLGNLPVSGPDLWWTIDDKTNTDELSQGILNDITNLGLPEIKKYLDDESLRDLWMTGQSPALTDTQRLKYLLILIKEIGPRNKMEYFQDQLSKVLSGQNL